MTQLKNSSNKDVSGAEIIHGEIVLWIDPFAARMCAFRKFLRDSADEEFCDFLLYPEREKSGQK